MCGKVQKAHTADGLSPGRPHRCRGVQYECVVATAPDREDESNQRYGPRFHYTASSAADIFLLLFSFYIEKWKHPHLPVTCSHCPRTPPPPLTHPYTADSLSGLEVILPHFTLGRFLCRWGWGFSLCTPPPLRSTEVVRVQPEFTKN